jgi:hypothetical protein
MTAPGTAKGLPPGPHLDLLLAALETEAGAQRALLDGDRATATTMFATASHGYRASYECAPPASYGRLIGLLKAAIIAGDPVDAAAFARDALADAPQTPTAAYARAIVALVDRDDATARTSAAAMTEGDDRFDRAAEAITALVDSDRVAYSAAIAAIVRDFEGRSDHLTGVAIADTAVMLEALAAARGLACTPQSRVMPAAG